MTPHRWAITILLIGLGSLFLLEGRMDVPIWAYISLIVAFLAVAIYGSSKVDSGYHLKVLTHGPRDRNEVALSFDDGPDPTVTPQVLDILSERGIRAVFFLIGEKVNAHPELVERMHREGHFIGNHSWSHAFFFDLLPTRAMVREIERTSKAIRSITGEPVRSFRPPYGVTNPMLRKAVKRSGLIPVGWDVGSMDSVKRGDKVFRRVLGKTRPGSILLFHDNDEKLVRILPEVLDRLEEKGFSFQSPDQLLQKEL